MCGNKTVYERYVQLLCSGLIFYCVCHDEKEITNEAYHSR